MNEHYGGTADDESEEGMGDDRSVCSESLGLHVDYNDMNNGMQLREEEPIPQIMPQFGLRVVTHPHEDEIPSNRKLTSCGEYVPAPCTHRPSSQASGRDVRRYHLVVSNIMFARRAKS